MAGYVQVLSVLGLAATESPAKHALYQVHQEHEYFFKRLSFDASLNGM